MFKGKSGIMQSDAADQAWNTFFFNGKKYFKTKKKKKKKKEHNKMITEY